MKLTVNGKIREFEAETDMPLLWILRDVLQLTGTRYGCGIGSCGACTVLIDGEPQRSCQLTAADVEGAIVTIEGLPEGGALHVVQQVWMEQQVPQCGYCQSGQIMAAVALLNETPRPTDTDIDEAMTNLCRCGTYPHIRAAIHKAAEKIGA